MSRQTKTNNYAYAAGLIDGEGCVSIRKVPCGSMIGGYAYSLTVLVNQTDGGAIDFVFGVFGGSVYVSKQYGLGNLPVYRWELRSEKAAGFLKHILPFLRIKKAQAELALRFQNSIRKQNKGSMPLEQFEREFRHWCYEEMKRLKGVHCPPCAALETEREHPSLEGMLQSELTGKEPLEVDVNNPR